jgi:hypothetical protein
VDPKPRFVSAKGDAACQSRAASGQAGDQDRGAWMSRAGIAVPIAPGAKEAAGQLARARGSRRGPHAAGHRPDWATLRTLVFHVGVVLLEHAIDRQLPEPLRREQGLERW